MQLHIKTDGNWTSKLRDIDLKYIAVDGPYGAPAQRFYDFDQTIIVGAGIGVTPFSGILNDLQTREDHGWRARRYSTTTNETSSDKSDITRVGRRRQPRRLSRHRKIKQTDEDTPNTASATKSRQASLTEKLTEPAIPTDSRNNAMPQLASQTPGSTLPQSLSCSETEKSTLPKGHNVDLSLYRRADFHWIVRDKNHLLWFSSLLNKLSGDDHCPSLDIRIHPHLTKKFKDPPISLHVYRCLLEKHRTDIQPISPLTGLITPTHFGRPDFPKIIDQHYQDMLTLFENDKSRKRRVGVFFCGAPVIGAQLADLCHEMTLRGREDGSEIEYHFQIEVFG